MRASARHTVLVVVLAVAGLVVAVVLGVIVSRAASESVALGGADLGDRNHLVVTAPSSTIGTTTSPTRTVTVTRTVTAPATTATTGGAPPVTTTSGDDDRGGGGGHRDGDGDSDD